MVETKETILIADDDPHVGELLKRYLEPLGCDIVKTTDGREALKFAQENLPAVVLLDVQMPGRSGWEVCQTLKGVQKTADIGVILMTGRGDVKDRLTGLQVGADDYLVKPFQRHEVLRRVGRLVDLFRERSVTGVPEPEASTTLRSVLVDPVTGLPSIPAVIDRIKEMLIQECEVDIIYVDVEEFETMEAEYGWAYFDNFLRLSGMIIEREARERLNGLLATVSRVGGSSFYLFAGPDLTESGARLDAIAEQVHKRLVSEMSSRVPAIQSGQISFFIGTTRVEYVPQIRLERQIYAGMQRAADAVRTAEQERKAQLLGDLRDIIARRRVTTLFQPIVHAADGRIFGYEILTRGPKDSLFRNSDMLFSFARDADASWELEALALESSLERLRHVELGDRKFLFNLEAEMFDISEFRFHEMVDFFASHPGHFVFELTERAAIEDYGEFKKRLEDFRRKGIEIAIDDAGSGYASLEAIASLAPDYLKVTKGLVSALATEPIKQDLLTMLVELARKIGATTIAEGIETEEEFAWCRDLGIDLLQGYYIAHPAEDLAFQISTGGGARI